MRRQTCDICDGEGVIYNEHEDDEDWCPECQGDGEICSECRQPIEGCECDEGEDHG